MIKFAFHITGYVTLNNLVSFRGKKIGEAIGVNGGI